MTSETYARVQRILAKRLAIPVESIEADAKLTDLGVDSLAALELIFELEEEFEVSVPDERLSELGTVRAICDGIEALQSA